MFYISVIFWLLSISSLLVFVTKKRFEIIVPFTYILSVFIIYIFTYFNQLRLGYIITLVIGLLSVIYITFKCLKDNVFKKEFLNNYLTIGTFIFLLLVIYSFVLYQHKGFEACDEFMHWGTMVRETFRLNGFYSLPESILRTHKDYPPFFCLLETMWCLFAGTYKEPYVYMGLVTFMWSLFMPLFSKYDYRNKKDIVKSFLLLIAIVLFGLINSRTVTASDWAFMYNTIYVDWTLCIFLAFNLFFIYRNKEYDNVFYFLITLSFTTLIFMKQMGIPFYMLSMLYLVLKMCLVDKKKFDINFLVCTIIVPILAFITWKHIISTYGIVGQFNVGETIKSLFDSNKVIDPNLPLYRPTVFKYFISQIIKRPLFLHPFKMPFFVVIAIQSIFLIKNNRYLGAVYLFGSLAYSFTMLILYLFSFSYEEALELASFDRYMNSYLICGFALCLMIASTKFTSIKSSIIIIIVTLLFVEFNNFYQLIPSSNTNKTLFTNVLVVDRKGKGKEPIDRSDLGGVMINITDDDYIDYQKMASDEFVEELAKYGAVYVISTDSDFLNLWNEANLDIDLHNNDLYDIYKSENGLVLNKNFMYLNQVVFYYYQ